MEGTLMIGDEPVLALEGVAPGLADRLSRRLGATHDPRVRACGVIVRDVATVGDAGRRTEIRIGRRDAGYGPEGWLRFGDGVAAAYIRSGDQPIVTAAGAAGDVTPIAALGQLALLERGIVPLHAASLEIGGRSVAICGWSRGGRTRALLAALDRGAAIHGAEWLYLTARGAIPAATSLRVRPDHLEAATARRLLGARRSRTLGLQGRMAAALEGLGPAAAPPRGASGLVRAPGALAARVSRLGTALERRSYVDVDPPAGRSAPHGDGIRGDVPGAGASSRLTLAAAIIVAPTDGPPGATDLGPDDLAERISAALAEDLRDLDAVARRHTFGTGRRPGWGADWQDRYRAALRERLQGVAGSLLLYRPGASLEVLGVSLSALSERWSDDHGAAT